MASEYTKRVVIACPSAMVGGAQALLVEAAINAHLGGSNSFSNAALFEKDASEYRVLSFAAKAAIDTAFNEISDTQIKNGSGAQMIAPSKITIYIDSVGTAPQTHVADMTLNKVNQ